MVIGGIAIALAKAAPHLLPYGGKSDGPALAFPHGVVLFIAGLCFIFFLTEGAVLDWSAVFLTSARGTDASYAGLGYAAFAMTMTVGRLSGDRIVQHFGTANIIIFGGLCAATGFVLATLISCLAGDTAGLCMGRRGLLECGAGPVHRCWPTDRDARKCRRSGDQRYGLRRYPRRSGRHWLGGAHGKPLGCISDPGAYAIWGRCQQSPAAALRAYQPTSGRFSPPIPHRCAGGQLVTFVRLAHSTISAWVSPVSECWRRIAGPMAAISGERPFTTRSVRSNRHKEKYERGGHEGVGSG